MLAHILEIYLQIFISFCTGRLIHVELNQIQPSRLSNLAAEMRSICLNITP